MKGNLIPPVEQQEAREFIKDFIKFVNEVKSSTLYTHQQIRGVRLSLFFWVQAFPYNKRSFAGCLTSAIMQLGEKNQQGAIPQRGLYICRRIWGEK